MVRRMKRSRVELIRDDLNKMIEEDGNTVTFTWKEITGGVWNEAYEIFEGGTETEKTFEIKGLGRVVDYAEDEMEYEYGRIKVGDCYVRFPWDADLSPIMNKEGIRFLYKGQRWKLDSDLDVGESLGDEMYSILIKGVKATD